MKKFILFIIVYCVMHYSQGFGQTITYLQNGKIISESNGSLLDITNGDSLVILKNMILIKYSTGISNDSITLIEQTNDLERRYTCTTGWVIYNVPDTNALIALTVRLLTQIDSSQLAFDHPLTYFTSTPDDPEYPRQWYFPDIKACDSDC